MSYSWETKNLQELEGNDWGEAPYRSHVVESCHLIRRKRLIDLSIEELRLAIGQEIGLKYLLPVALRYLAKNPFAQGDFFPGDLLLNVLRVPITVWQESPPLRALHTELKPIIESFFGAADRMDDLWKESYLPQFRGALSGTGENSD